MYCYNLNTKYISSLDNNIIVIEEISARLCTRERKKLIELNFNIYSRSYIAGMVE